MMSPHQYPPTLLLQPPRSPKRSHKPVTLDAKLEIFKKSNCWTNFGSGQSFVACGREYGINESTVRYIKKKERDICNTVALSAPSSAQEVTNMRDTAMVKMEKALNIWIEDFNRHHIPLSQKFIRDKAKTWSKSHDFVPPKMRPTPMAWAKLTVRFPHEESPRKTILNTVQRFTVTRRLSYDWSSGWRTFQARRELVDPAS
ncbi:CENPB DNA-binding domain containing protein 1-like 39, partial [Homarus americanus]